eukprot:Clim_evm11s210 gene=Clim_evmTU11s210
MDLPLIGLESEDYFTALNLDPGSVESTQMPSDSESKQVGSVVKKTGSPKATSPKSSKPGSPAAPKSSDRKRKRTVVKVDEEEKRRRNCLASARFRAKKKQELHVLEEIAQAKTEECEILQNRVKMLEAEVAYMKRLLMTHGKMRRPDVLGLHSSTATATPPTATTTPPAPKEQTFGLNEEQLGLDFFGTAGAAGPRQLDNILTPNSASGSFENMMPNGNEFNMFGL